jgi:predicted aldo/keto reductase-like oxidoreductase
VQYRSYGTIGGDQISALGFGCMRLPETQDGDDWRIDEDIAIPLLRDAAARGVNYFDTGYYYCHRNSEATVGRALAPIREQVLISTKLPMGEVRKTADYRRWLEQSLQILGTNYVDYYHFWALDQKTFDEKVIGLGLLDEARKAKDQGLIRHISFSFHDKAEVIRSIIDRGEIFETMLVQYNLLDRSNEEMIAYAAGKGLGVAAMGPVGGGRLAAPTRLGQKLTNRAALSTYELAFRFVLGNPNISCALSGMGSADMLQKNLAVANDETPLTADEWRQITESLEQLRRFSDLYCTGCAYCQPCPAAIDIPKIFGCYTDHNVYELHAYAQKQFADYLKNGGKTIQDCMQCGFCERKCPQHLQVRAQLERVQGVLEGIAIA